MTAAASPPTQPTVTRRPPRGDLTDALATADGKARYVRALFHEIAPRYDDITVWLSFGRDAGWKDVLCRMAAVQPGERALDLACGTGDIAARLRAGGARVTALDLTPRMLALAASRPVASGVRWLCGDMQDLPVARASQDVVTIGYGLRNVSDLPGALQEIDRVLAPGGRVLSLDFTLPRSPVVRRAYLGYLRIVGGLVGQLLHDDPDTYRYIPESLRRYPGADGVARLMRTQGLTHAATWPLLGGLMAINTAVKPRRR